MRRPTVNDPRHQPASAISRETLKGKERNERDGLKESSRRIPLPMMLIIGALMGGTGD